MLELACILRDLDVTKSDHDVTTPDSQGKHKDGDRLSNRRKCAVAVLLCENLRNTVSCQISRKRTSHADRVLHQILRTQGTRKKKDRPVYFETQKEGEVY